MIRISSTQRSLLARRLSLYLRAGIPLLEALELLRTDGPTTAQRTLLSELIQGVKRGVPISQTLREFPRAFSPWHIHILTVGEQTGTLPAALLHLTELLSQKAALRRVLVQSFTYPFVIFCGTVAISAFLVFYSFPKIMPIFKGLNVALPVSTHILIHIVTLSKEWGIYAGALLILSIGMLTYMFRLKRVRNVIDPLLISLPFIGSCIKNHCLVSVFRTLHVLLKSGVRLDTSLSLAQEGIWNTSYRASLEKMYYQVLSGTTCTAYMRTEQHLYPLVVVQLLHAGERTGSLTESTYMAAEISEDSFRQELRVITSLLEPILMVVMGVVVGTVALAIISPMYALTQGLSLY
jgi:type II secretory pathway component PulF